ncbi:phage tail assembly chaperone [Acuticoccus mangrovi]|uniref:Phage tail assembly chaperone n=1 Tax=Acuticoccus mangrovi TaxID=2796142 RepID=A0A934IM89_9HYPH|nr:phage tail assembly chaperone [Acuticoccus mangrovi]MBJ3774817.1 phage tail assembly chaperone [Acuticoccus mangrovi]
MAFFLGERRMAPADFWALTLPEIEAVLGRGGASEVTRRGDLARLMEQFPDGR